MQQIFLFVKNICYNFALINKTEKYIRKLKATYWNNE